MTSTERLLAVLNGRIPDRVPISTYELVPGRPESFENRDPSYRRLMEFIAQHTDLLYMKPVTAPNKCWAVWKSAETTWDDGDQHVTKNVLHAPGRDLTTITSHSDTVATTWTREHTCKTIEDLQAYMALPYETGAVDFAELNAVWKQLDGRRGLPMLDMADPLCMVAGLFSMEDFVVLAMTETEAMVHAMEALHERAVEELRRTLQGPVKNCVFRITGPEYATPPFLPPELFAKFVTPFDSVYCRMMRDAGVFPRLHSHGKVGRVLDEIIKINPVAMDPVEPPPDGDISIADIKKRAPELVLMGGVELKHLEAASEQFVDKLIRDLMAQGKPGGRFVIMPTAAPINIPLAAKTEANYRRFITTALKVGSY